MDYKGAVFFDYDGTLADEANQIFLPTKATRDTVSKLRKMNYAIFLSTGRSKCYIPKIEGMFDGYVAANGAYAELDGQIIHSVDIQKTTIKNLIKEFETLDLEYSFEDQQAIYVKNINSERFINMLKTFDIPTDIMRPIDYMKNVCKGIVLFNSDEEFINLSERFKNVAVLDRHRTYNSADVTTPGVNKGTGVRAVIQKLNIPFENTYAFGDGTNDVEMLKAVHHGVAMGESAQSAIDVAEYVTDTVINEGITKAFKFYKLI